MRMCGFVESPTALYLRLSEDSQGLADKPSPCHYTGPLPSSAWLSRVPTGHEDLPGSCLSPVWEALTNPLFYSFCNVHLKPKDSPGSPTSLALSSGSLQSKQNLYNTANIPLWSILEVTRSSVLPKFLLLIYSLSTHLSHGIPETTWKPGGGGLPASSVRV